MDIITLIICIIVIALFVGLAFRLVSYALRIISLIVLIILLLALVGSYLQVEAFFLPSDHQSFMIIPDANSSSSSDASNSFVIDQDGRNLTYDSPASISLMKEITFFSGDVLAQEYNTTTYAELKKLANLNIFANSDTVWLIYANGMPLCNLDVVEQNLTVEQLDKDCIPPQQNISLGTIFNEAQWQKTLTKIPLKFSTWSWMKHKFTDLVN